MARLLPALAVLAITSASESAASPAATSADVLRPELRLELLDMAEEDQRLRRRALGGGPEALEELGAVDRRNAKRMERILEEQGWPGVSAVGRDGAQAAWLLVQHADHDPDFQELCLELLRGAVAVGEASPEHLAYLTDRVRTGRGEPQLYGTQLVQRDGRWEPKPIAEPDRLEARRAALGMSPYEEYLRRATGDPDARWSPEPAPAAAPAGSRHVRVILVRHAETVGGGRDPALAAEGRARAACLARLLASAGITHAYASPWRRTKETLAPLAEQEGLSVAVRDPTEPEALAAELAALPDGSVAVVAGHSNTIPALVQELGATLDGLVERGGVPALPEDEHDRILRLELRIGESTAPVLEELRDERQACPPSGALGPSSRGSSSRSWKDSPKRRRASRVERSREGRA